MEGLKEYTDQEYIDFDPFDGDRDVDIRCKTIKIVKVRKQQTCFFTEEHNIEPGERARYETAIVDGQWGSYYICLGCLKKWMNEIGY